MAQRRVKLLTSRGGVGFTQAAGEELAVVSDAADRQHAGDVTQAEAERMVAKGHAEWIGKPAPPTSPPQQPSTPAAAEVDRPSDESAAQEVVANDRVLGLLSKAGITTRAELRRRIDEQTITDVSGIGDATAADLDRDNPEGDDT